MAALLSPRLCGVRAQEGDMAPSPKDQLRRNFKKLSSMRTRVLSGAVMIAGFVAVIYLGHVYVWALIILLQTLMAKELFGLANNAQKQKKHALPSFRFLNWWFFFTAMVYVYGRFMYKQFLETVSTFRDEEYHFTKILVVKLVDYHLIICYAMYITGFVIFILRLQKKSYQAQFGQYAWSHMILFVVLFQSSFFVANLFRGIIWFLLPSSLIIINDCAAYFFGVFFGRTPLIKLSPKKTWEGFLGASVTTIVAAFLLAGYMGRFEWLTCPRRDLGVGRLHCDPGNMFRLQPYRVPSSLVYWLPRQLHQDTVTATPVQWHAIAFGVFASSIAPFGGFFASGFKRAFKIKDFGDSIPGHGGITDRMDCQMVMAMFSWIWYHTFISSSNVSVESLLSKVVKLRIDEQQELYLELGRHLCSAAGATLSKSHCRTLHAPFAD
eukprot:SM000071S21132  [mRNA]  locus=s71:539066:542704:- [translate_table: standard]